MCDRCSGFTLDSALEIFDREVFEAAAQAGPDPLDFRSYTKTTSRTPAGLSDLPAPPQTQWPPVGLERLDDRARSGKKRRWRERRLEADAIQRAYAELGRRDSQSLYGALSRRMAYCGNVLEFDVGENSKGRSVSKCRCRYSCQGRHCPVCQARKCHSLGIDLAIAVQEMCSRVLGCRAILLTSTTRNVPRGELKAEVKRQVKGFARMARWRRFKRSVLGGMRRIEITFNPVSQTWHVHIHAWLFVRPGYFSRKKDLFVDKPEWAAMLQKAQDLDYSPVVDVRTIRGVFGGRLLTHAGRKSIQEVAKYCTKPADIMHFDDAAGQYGCDPDLLKELHEGLADVRMVEYFGLFRKVRSELKRHEEEDAAGPAPEPGVKYRVTRIFAWHWAPRRVMSDYFLIAEKPIDAPTQRGDADAQTATGPFETTTSG